MKDGNEVVDLSIITVCLNSMKSINKTFESIKNQSLMPKEYIIVDGGSTDGTLELSYQFKDSVLFPVKIVSGVDNGISSAFNVGIKMATSKWIHILNSDDYYLSNDVLKNLQGILQDNLAGVIFCGGLFEQRVKPNVYRYSRTVKGSLKYSMSVVHPACFVKQEIYDKVGYFSESYKTAMDYEFLTRVERKLGRETFKEVDYYTTFIGYGGESIRNRQRGFREVASAQMVNTDLPVLYILLRYIIYSLFFCTRIGRVVHRLIKALAFK